MKNRTRRRHCLAIFDAAVAAVLPARFVPPYLPAPPETGKLILLAAGKAAGSMAAAAERHYLRDVNFPAIRMRGLAITRYGYGVSMEVVESLEVGHPVPDMAGVAATRRLLDLVAHIEEGDLVVFLLSGGASANLVAPVGRITLEEKQNLTRSLLRSGASIDHMNAVRKHLSAIKGGRLAARVAPANLVTIALSDVPNDDLSSIGSGPTVPDITTLDEARSVLERFSIEVPPSIRGALDDPANETLKPGDPVFSRTSAVIAARPTDAFSAACEEAARLGYTVVNLGAQVEGEACAIGAQHAAIARREAANGGKIALISGGELTVTIKGDGRGGPSQEYALALAIELGGAEGIVALACDTDGTDGGSGDAADPAGALIDSTTLARAAALGLDPASYLSRNDSTGFFSALGDLHTPGPTLTNANDLRVILIDD